MRTVHPHDQPVRPAIALLVVSALLLVVWVASELLPRMFVDDLVEVGPSDEFTGMLRVITLVLVSLVVLMLGLGLASLILAVVVAVKGGGKLRLGAALMIAAVLFSLVVSFTVTGDTSQLPDAAVAASNAFSILESIVNAARAVAMVVGAVLLVFGIREVRQQRAELARTRAPQRTERP